MDNVLVLVRHGQSEWNAKNLFTGWKDVDLTPQGIAEARSAGETLKKAAYRFDIAFTSDLIRAQKTLTLILEELGQSDLETVRDIALNERNYGDLVGLNKDDARKKWGDEQVHIWRRSYDTPPPGGESQNVIVSAHGNSLRAIIMKLDNLSRDEVTQLNLATGVPIIYRFNEDGSIAEKKDLAEVATA